MNMKHVVLASMAALSVGSANAALSCIDSTSDAGTTYLSTDLFLCNADPNLAGSGTFFLEALDPNLQWGLVTLSVTNASDSLLSAPPINASINGVSGSFVTAIDNDPTNSDGSAGFTYRFSFAGLTLAPNAESTVQVGGFPSASGGNSGTVMLFATAVPEAESYAMMLAGLGVLGFLGRRRRIGK